jgi:hypothetical protein
MSCSFVTGDIVTIKRQTINDKWYALVLTAQTSSIYCPFGYPNTQGNKAERIRYVSILV